jgi:hypothetical protein
MNNPELEFHKIIYVCDILFFDGILNDVIKCNSINFLISSSGNNY